MMTRSRLQRGVTFIELLIAQILGLLVIAGALAIFAPAMAGLEQARAIAMTQESGRLALSTLALDIAQAGYAGCGRRERTHSVIDSSAAGLSRRLSGWAYAAFNIMGIDQGDLPRINDVLGRGWNERRYTQGDTWYGDLLFVQSVHPGEFRLVAHDQSGHALILAGDLRETIRPGQLLGIADCTQRTLFQVDRNQAPVFDAGSNTTLVSYQPDATANCATLQTPDRMQVGLGGRSRSPCYGQTSLSHSTRYQFASGSSLFPISNSLYYIAIQPETDTPSLYRMAMAANAGRLNTEIVAEGIESMRVRFGYDEDNDGAPDRYASPTMVSLSAEQTPAIVSIRIWLLVTSLTERGRSDFSTTVSFPDPDGQLVICDSRAAANNPACPIPSRHHAHRQVLFQELMLRNGGA